MSPMIKRRKFLQQLGIGSSGLIIGISLLESCTSDVRSGVSPIPEFMNGFDVDGASQIGEYIQIKPDGNIFVNIVKHEMGQGVASGMLGIIADELDADWSKVNLIYTPPITGLDNWAGGSTSTLKQWDIMRNAGALVRKLLVNQAAAIWNISSDECYTESNHVIQKGTGEKIEYGQLVEGIRYDEETVGEVKLKDPKDFKFIGQSFQNNTIPDMVLGRHPYAIDVQLPNMKYAVIERVPVWGGKLIDFDATEALKMPGVEKVVPIEGLVVDSNSHIRPGVAVIANNTWAALEARKLLKINWKLGGKRHIVHENFLDEAYRLLNTPEGEHSHSEGERSAMQEADSTITHTYEFPYQHHACMEPLNATAMFDEHTCEVWVGTQAANYMIRNITKHFGVPEDQIKLHCHPSGGGFGLRYWASHGMEALMVSKAAGGDLVKMMYSREDDIKFDFPNPLQICKHTVGLKNNALDSWHIKSIIDNWGGLLAWMIYDIPNKYAEQIQVDGFTQMSAWRSVMANAESFATECFIDEVATEVGKDPLKFRLEYLKTGIHELNHKFPFNYDRMRHALELAAEKSSYGKVLGKNTGQGIALFPYMHGNGYGAAVAEVSVHQNEVKVTKIDIAIECGLVVNPDFVKKQMEGGVIWALTALFYGGTEYKNGVVARSNFHDNKLLRINEVPQIEVHICESTETQPWGVGEIAPPVIYPAVCNAIFAATGKRIRKLPLNGALL